MSVDADLCDQILKIFQHGLNLEVPSIETDLIETGVLDSLLLVDLLLRLEVQFQISISPEDLETDNFRSIEGITSLVASKKAWTADNRATDRSAARASG